MVRLLFDVLVYRAIQRAVDRDAPPLGLSGWRIHRLRPPSPLTGANEQLHEQYAIDQPVGMGPESGPGSPA